MGPVKDQGACGSCYAFSGLSALEAGIAIKTGQAPVRLSEQEWVDCSGSGGVDIFGTNYNNGGCMGGLEYFGWEYMRDHGGLTNADYPYTAMDEACKRTKDDPRVAVTDVTGW